MNKQTDRLISADKLLEWLEKEAFVWFGRYGELGEGYCKACSNVKTAMESGEFDPDPIPLPTLKPGDKVKHSNILEPVTVVWMGKEMAVIQDYLGNNYDAFIQDLEPIKEGR